MRIAKTTVVLLGMAMLALPGCGRDWVPTTLGPCVFDADCFEGYKCVNGRCMLVDVEGGDGGVRLLDFGERCEENQECRSGFCLPHPEGAFCTQTCEAGCPVGWVCKYVLDPRGGPDRLGLCAVAMNRLCKPCQEAIDCNPAGSDRCEELAEGRFCLMDCWFEDCPTGYACQDVTEGEATLRQCWPTVGCTCSEANDGAVRGCEQASEHGTCTGFEECDHPAGWTDCSAREPVPEDCNGVDDDCNGFVDDELTPSSCTEENVYGRCTGEEECRGLEGWVCGAPEPAPEGCDSADNDCDGEVDEDFRDAEGRYVSDAHCGACGTDCAVMIPNAAVSVCRVEEQEPVCRATACEPGYFVYEAGLACLLLPANLCQTCSHHEDCVAPGSLCIESGPEMYCGRDCSDASPYGPGCPGGYVCAPHGGLMQCQPESDTCLCTADTLGTVRSCTLDTCTGYETCVQDGAVFRWTPCNVDDFNVEICDGLDNNCNGMVDEGFLNPQTGRYESDAHCGFCHNDCSRYWSEPIDHTVGVCDVTAPGMPTCAMGPCSVETENGTQYEWVDVNLSQDDGCECRRVLGNVNQDPPDLIDEPEPGLVYADENCDGVDGVVTQALFVRADAPAEGNGSIDRPYTTIWEAIAAFPGSGKDYILVAEGIYDEQIWLIPGVALHGGYAADFLSRDVVAHASVVEAFETGPAIRAEGITGAPTLVSGFVLQGGNESTEPVPTYAVILADCDESVEIRSCRIVGGRGADGVPGGSGAAGFGSQDSPALDGGDGLNGQRRSGACIGSYERAGGEGGSNQSCPASDGNPGGTTVCPSFDWDVDPVRGTQAQYTSEASGNGLGGNDWSFDSLSGFSCSHATESGFPTDIQLNVGKDGRDGLDGENGLGGTGGRQVHGEIGASGLWWASWDGLGTRGAVGQAGAGGGGGGGGGGTAYFNQGLNDCDMHEVGPSGGGGGAGGCGGSAGWGGAAGLASIAVLVTWTGPQPAATSPRLTRNVIQRGVGGSGGDGGFGGMGGLGGPGGFGGQPPDWISSLGGKGGDGGNGGPGGGGGGGAGGPSFGILGFNLGAVDYAASNTFVFDDTVSTAGPGGNGGISVGPGATGGPGLAGVHRNLLLLERCGVAGCPAGFVCSGEACVPAD